MSDGLFYRRAGHTFKVGIRDLAREKKNQGRISRGVSARVSVRRFGSIEKPGLGPRVFSLHTHQVSIPTGLSGGSWGQTYE